MTINNKLLITRKLSFSYSSAQGVKGESNLILDNFDFTLKEGELLCILGPSGCGKSTLLKLLAGFLTPQRGEVLYRGERVDRPYRKGQMVFQDTSQLLPWLRVRENICFSQKRSLSAFRQEIPGSAKLKEILALTGLTDSADLYPSQLSGGMKQRCALGRALYGKPDILFMDEPFVSLDAPSRSVLQKLVLDIGRKGKRAIVFVTHDIREALLLADRIIIFTEPGGTIAREDNTLKRPRDGRSESFIREEVRLYSLLESSLDASTR